VTAALRLLGVLMAFRGAGNLLKRFGTGSGMVVFGRLWPPDSPVAVLVGLVMVAYGWGLWTRAAWAVPLGVAYALFATANLVLFPLLTGLPPSIAPWMYGVYVVAGLALAWGAVWLLVRARSPSDR
jgi:hypothetical protein